MDENKKIDAKVFILKVLAVVFLVLSLLMMLMIKFMIVDENIFSNIIGAISVIVGLILVIKGIKNKFLKSYRAGDVLKYLILNFCAISFFLYFTACYINCAFDQQDREIFILQVKDVSVLYVSSRYTSYEDRFSWHAEVKNWRNKSKVFSLNITKDEFKEVKREPTGRTLTLVTKPGLLGEEWIVSVEVNSVGYKSKEINSEQQNAGGLPMYNDT